jgi:signal transduction histidine kinase
MVLPIQTPQAAAPLPRRAATGLKNMLTVYPAWEPTLTVLVRNMAVVITFGCVIMSITNGLLSLGPASVVVNLIIPVFILLAVVYIRSTGRFGGAFISITVLVFLIIFPVAFFWMGGIQGALPYYYFLAVTVTALMMQGLRFYLAMVLELVVFGGVMEYSLRHPESLTPLPLESLEQSLPICLLTVSVAIALAVHSVYRFYLRTALELESSNARLREGARHKDAFLALIAHELKTPMAIMSTHAQEVVHILESVERPSPELSLAQRDVEIMMNQAESLSAMVSQLLDVSRANEGRLILSIRPVDLSQIVQTTLAECAPICAANGNQLLLAQGGAHPRVLGDSARLVRVLVNLIANATRHTHDGSITLSLAKEGQYARVTVADTGEGMSPEALEAALKGEGSSGAAYMRSGSEGDVSLPVPVAVGSRHGGLGLGLRLVRHIVEAHGGEFSLESELGRGTRAAFTIPLAV